MFALDGMWPVRYSAPLRTSMTNGTAPASPRSPRSHASSAGADITKLNPVAILHGDVVKLRLRTAAEVNRGPDLVTELAGDHVGGVREAGEVVLADFHGGGFFGFAVGDGRGNQRPLGGGKAGFLDLWVTGVIEAGSPLERGRADRETPA